MSNQFLNFEDCHIKIGGKTLFATNASMQINPQIGEDRVYGKFNKEIVGTSTQLHRQPAMGPIEGTLDVTFYITTEFFNMAVDSIFDVEKVDEKPITNNRIGRYIMGDLYLNKFNFKLKPFNIIEATASYFMTGTLYRDRTLAGIPVSTMENFDPAHSLRCFVVTKAGGQDMQELIDDVEGQDYTFEITDLDYSITVERNKSALIRENEHTSVNTRPAGAEFSRVSVNNMSSIMQISSNELVDRLNPYGEHQSGAFVPGTNSSICAYLYTINGTRLAKFQCVGKIIEQSMSVNKDGMTTANLKIKEIIR